MIGRLYIITNDNNDYVYIGKTYNTLYNRWLGHLDTMREGNRKPLYNAMRKYGYKTFHIKLLGLYQDGTLEEKEHEYILKYKKKGIPLYNLSNGFDGSMPSTYEYEDKILDLYINARKSINDIANDINCSKSSVSMTLKNNYIFPDNINKYRKNSTTRKVMMLDLKTRKSLISFDSIAEAGRFLEISDPSHIVKVCKGKRGYAYGYRWKYI